MANSAVGRHPDGGQPGADLGSLPFPVSERSVVLAASPNVVAISAYQRYRGNMQDFGVGFWEYQGPDSLHGKAAIVDDRVSYVGSYNVDSRSESSNTELMLVVDDFRFASELRADLEGHIEEGGLMRAENGGLVPRDDLEVNRPSFVKVYLSRILSFYMPLLQYYV